MAQSGSDAQAKRTLKILCFGDSLTEGYAQWGAVMAPYSKTLGKVLREKMGEEWEIEVATEGVSGELVMGMPRRMGRVYEKPENKLSPPDFTIFLGGTNDLAYNRPANTILNDIKATVAVPLSRGARVLLMTVPECKVKRESLDTRRNELNGLIKGYAEENKDVFVFDLFDKIQYHSMDEEDRHEIWDDGLHLTAEGYRWMGELAAKRLLEILGATDEPVR
ncbi:hypothetical protein G7Y89_g12134 [Cudoniella acicularis]|uniref:SGNH hydrolase-type esterase domain-containing protein n=1 Tax=Cudoniella acicularis TaxID=354080 RepID=A0A8H4RAN4_9HELO|nr:hypothetical protein G7Y89_g12134 [Cudoniella acicularis]